MPFVVIGVNLHGAEEPSTEIKLNNGFSIVEFLNKVLTRESRSWRSFLLLVIIIRYSYVLVDNAPGGAARVGEM